MRLCLFSDIHGNIDAMEKMLDAELYETDLFLFIGDIFGYFYDQKKVIDILMSLKNLIAVKGNHEKNYLDGFMREEMIDKFGNSYNTALSDIQRDYLRQLPEYLEILIDNKRFGIFHGGPKDHLEQRIYPNTEIKDRASYEQYEFLILGHTHYRLQKKSGGTTIINPGSLGQPRDGKGFSYCVLDTKSGASVFKSVNIAVHDLLSQVRRIDAGKTVCSYLEKNIGRSCCEKDFHNRSWR